MSGGVITTAGISAMLAAQISGAPFSPDLVKVSSAVSTTTGAETSLSSIVYTAPAANVIQVATTPNLMRTILYMDTTVGDFIIGSVGIFDSISGILFAIFNFPGAGMKLASSPPQQVGNIRTLYLDAAYANIATTLNLELTTLSSNTLTGILATLAG
jgi:hypothetical protein